MAGLAVTDNEILSSATVMIGPRADLLGLNSLQHSVGLAKNFSLSTSPSYNALTQGLTNETVQSVMTASGLSMSVDAYEFTQKNLQYVSGLDGSASSFEAVDIDTTTVAFTPGDTDIVVAGDVSANYAVGDRVVIQVGTTDQTHTVILSAVAATTDTTLSFTADWTTPVGALDYPIGSRVIKAKSTNYGGVSTTPTFAMKVVGTLPANGTPISIMVPRVRITGGMAVNMSPDTWASMPVQFTPEALRPGEDFYSMFPNNTLMSIDVTEAASL